MEQAHIRSYLHKHIEGIIDLCDEAGLHFDKNTIHELRVEVKKLRALLRFLNWTCRTTGAKLPGRLRKLYHTAGYLREAQLELDMIADEDLPLHYYTIHLQTVITAQKHTWNSLYTGKPLGKAGERYSEANFIPLEPSMLHGYIAHQVTEVKAICAEQHLTDDQLHDIRKHLKDIVHLAKFADIEWPAASKLLHSAITEDATELAKLIGDFNDARLFYTHLATFGVHTPDELEQKAIANLLLAKKEELVPQKAAIMQAVHAFITAH